MITPRSVDVVCLAHNIYDIPLQSVPFTSNGIHKGTKHVFSLSRLLRSNLRDGKILDEKDDEGLLRGQN